MQRLTRGAMGVACAAALGGCGTISEFASEKMADTPLVGLPTGVPERPATPVAFPAVHDIPPRRPTPVMSDVEQQKMENDLVAARQRQQLEAGIIQPEPPPEPPAPPPAPTSRKKPASSANSPRAIPAATSATIY